MDRFGKTFSILKNDKLSSTQKIKPILERISRTISLFFHWILDYSFSCSLIAL
jgi:hypothetical protein